jgi:hypothetical protein
MATALFRAAGDPRSLATVRPGRPARHDARSRTSSGAGRFVGSGPIRPPSVRFILSRATRPWLDSQDCDAAQDEQHGDAVQDVEGFADEEPADGERDEGRDVGGARRGDGSEVLHNETAPRFSTMK